MTTTLRVNDHGTWRQGENSRLHLWNLSHVEEWQLQTARFKKCRAVPAQPMKAQGGSRDTAPLIRNVWWVALSMTAVCCLHSSGQRLTWNVTSALQP